MQIVFWFAYIACATAVTCVVALVLAQKTREIHDEKHDEPEEKQMQVVPVTPVTPRTPPDSPVRAGSVVTDSPDTSPVVTGTDVDGTDTVFGGPYTDYRMPTIAARTAQKRAYTHRAGSL